MGETEVLKQNHPDLIHGTVIAGPQHDEIYEVIKFDKFLERLFPNLDLFLPSNDKDISREIRTSLESKYGNSNKCIMEKGALKRVKVNELKYFQSKVGINGPKNSNINEPVYVINKSNSLLLFNGYHRTLFHMINKCVTIEAYVLAI
jgi:hypothetical protein